MSLDCGGLRGHSLVSAGEQTEDESPEEREEKKAGKGQKTEGVARDSTAEIGSALAKSSFDLHLISKLLKMLFAFLIWTEQRHNGPSEHSLPNHLNQAHSP